MGRFVWQTLFCWPCFDETQSPTFTAEIQEPLHGQRKATKRTELKTKMEATISQKVSQQCVTLPSFSRLQINRNMTHISTRICPILNHNTLQAHQIFGERFGNQLNVEKPHGIKCLWVPCFRSTKSKIESKISCYISWSAILNCPFEFRKKTLLSYFALPVKYSYSF